MRTSSSDFNFYIACRFYSAPEHGRMNTGFGGYHQGWGEWSTYGYALMEHSDRALKYKRCFKTKEEAEEVLKILKHESADFSDYKIASVNH